MEGAPGRSLYLNRNIIRTLPQSLEERKQTTISAYRLRFGSVLSLTPDRTEKYNPLVTSTPKTHRRVSRLAMWVAG